MDSDSPDYYRFVQCPNQECSLRFPGVVGVKCPLCKEATEFAAERAAFIPPQTEKPIRSVSFFLDNIRSVFNVGSIFRSSDGCAAAHLYLAGITPTPEHVAMKKTALGAQDVVPWSSHRNGPLLAARLAKEGHHLWALECTEGSENILGIEPASIPASVVLVLGNEVTGVDPEILVHCERTVYIPMRGQKESLNVATAMGVAGYFLSA